MRIALVCPYSLSRPGGVQGQVIGLAGALSSLVTPGGAVAVVAPVDGATPEIAGVDVLPVGGSVGVPANGSVAPLALDPRAAYRTRSELRRWRPDVVHVHEPLAPLVGWAAIGARLPAPRVATLHRAGGAGLYRASGPAGKRLLGRCRAVVAVSAEARATAGPVLGGRPCPVVGNGVDLARFAGAPPAPTDGPTVLFVGRHEPRKGLGVLLAAMGRAETTGGPEAAGRLWIVGEGPETAELRRRYPDGPRRRWWGRVDDTTLAGLFAGAHVVCAPSIGGESFGVVLLEAMAASAVVVCSAIPGYLAVLGGHGVAVPPGDAPALAAALQAVVADVARGTGPAAAGALSAAAAHARRWSMPVLAEAYLSRYRAVIGSPA